MCRVLEPNEDRFRREYGAIPMQGSTESFLSVALLQKATRPELTILREPGVAYTAAMDPGFTRNPWTFAIAGKRRCGERIKKSVVFTREWQGSPSNPLDPRVVLLDIKKHLLEYGVEGVESDRYEKFGLRSIGTDVGVYVYQRESTSTLLERCEQLETELADGLIELPEHKVMRADLLAAKRKLTANGFTMHLPDGSEYGMSGRHCDWVPTLSLVLSSCLADPVPVDTMPAHERAVWTKVEADARRRSDPFELES